MTANSTDLSKAGYDIVCGMRVTHIISLELDEGVLSRITETRICDPPGPTDMHARYCVTHFGSLFLNC